METVIQLDTYRQAKTKQTSATLDSAVPIFSWKNDYRVLLRTQSAFIRRIAIDALEKLVVNPANPMQAMRGSRISVTLDRKSMEKENLSQDVVFVTIRHILHDITDLMPEQNFVYPKPPNKKVQISLYLP